METCKNYVALHDKIKNIKTTMLTVTVKGKMRSFPLPTVQTECEGYMWFFININQDQLNDLGSRPAANISFCDNRTSIYVSVTGNIEICLDQTKKEEMWKPNLADFLKADLASGDLALIKFNVEFAEYWDKETGFMRDIWQINPLESPWQE